MALSGARRLFSFNHSNFRTDHNINLDLQQPRPIMCFAIPPDHHEDCTTADEKKKKKKKKKKKMRQRETPQALKMAVSGLTELLRLFSSFDQTNNRESERQIDELSLSSVDDVIAILEHDFLNAYFVTGVFSCAIYDEDCVFEDPTIRFKGRELYSRNLKLLVPFFDSPSIGLKRIQKNVTSDPNSVIAAWKLRTYLKLPWRPLISINGSTVYELDDEFRIVRHAESWSISAFEAIIQIFTPSFGRTQE